jgi:hypothetical protein
MKMKKKQILWALAKTMCDPAPLHRSAEIEDLTHLTEEDKTKISEEAEKGKNLLQPHDQSQHLAHSSLQNIHKTSLNQQNSNPK